jgi:hypothetical protein
MEELKSSVRSYNAKEQHREDLGQKPTYYRVTLHNSHRDAGSGKPNAVYTIHQLMPNARADLLNGNWQVFVEAFHGSFDMDGVDHNGIQICLPDMRKGSNDFHTTDVGVTQTDTSIAHIGAARNATELLIEDAQHDEVDTTNIVPLGFNYTTTISEHDIGRTIDPAQLFAGQIRVQIMSGNDEVAMSDDSDDYSLRLLFVHKP